jgi:prepilin-type N-terminal cleavage/methylation domain-containing protein
MKHKQSQGFTLIELLVVIAIIGILAAVVLVSLGDAKKGGSSASVQQSLDGVRSQAQLVYNTANDYANVCNDAKVQSLVNSAAANGADTDKVGTFETVPTTAATWNVAVCHSQAAGWVIEAPLADSTGSSSLLWCVDSTGFAGNDSTPIGGTDLTCN